MVNGGSYGKVQMAEQQSAKTPRSYTTCLGDGMLYKYMHALHGCHHKGMIESYRQILPLFAAIASCSSEEQRDKAMLHAMRDGW